MKSLRLYSQLLLVLLPITLRCAAENLTYMRIDESVLEKRVTAMPFDIGARISVLRSQFRSAGCKDPLLEEKVAVAVLPNLICILPGRDPGTLVIAASIDYRANGDEERVQWATLELLPLLAESLNSSVHHHTLIFAALSGHNHEFVGSRIFLERLSSAERNNLIGMIYLDHLGRVPPAYAHSLAYHASKVWGGTLGATPTVAQPDNVLTANVGVAARSLKVDQPAEINGIAPTDTSAFSDSGIPTINFHSLSYRTLVGIGQTETHQLRTVVDPSVYKDTYNFLCVYVLVVDKLLGGERGASRDAESDGSGPTHL